MFTGCFAGFVYDIAVFVFVLLIWSVIAPCAVAGASLSFSVVSALHDDLSRGTAPKKLSVHCQYRCGAVLPSNFLHSLEKQRNRWRLGLIAHVPLSHDAGVYSHSLVNNNHNNAVPPGTEKSICVLEYHNILLSHLPFERASLRTRSICNVC